MLYLKDIAYSTPLYVKANFKTIPRRDYRKPLFILGIFLM